MGTAPNTRVGSYRTALPLGLQSAKQAPAQELVVIRPTSCATPPPRRGLTDSVEVRRRASLHALRTLPITEAVKDGIPPAMGIGLCARDRSKGRRSVPRNVMPNPRSATRFPGTSDLGAERRGKDVSRETMARGKGRGEMFPPWRAADCFREWRPDAAAAMLVVGQREVDVSRETSARTSATPTRGRFHVKHENEERLVELETLERLLSGIGVSLPMESLERMLAHVAAVVAAQDRVRLTSITGTLEAMRLHIVDSLTCLQELNETCGICADVGSGAGFPGIPLAIASGREIVLVESVGKKAEFLRQTVDELGLGSAVSVCAIRAEELAGDQPGAFGAVTVRAVSELPALVELAAPLLSVGGRLIAQKGAPAALEIERGDRVAALVGLRRVSLRRLELPGGGERRAVVVYTKDSVSKRRLPRRPGLAQKSPLA